MKLKLIMLASVFAFGFAFTANAGSVVDTDSDLVPDAYDNCTTVDNGPGEQSNQVDSDQDGYGNACDTDYTQDDQTTTADFGVFFPAFTGATPDLRTDHNGDGNTTTADFGTFFADFSSTPANPPGPSGLACAGTIPCLP